MTWPKWTKRFAIAVILALGGCGPQVEIVKPANGETVTDSTFVAQMEFAASARTFTVVLDSDDVSNDFFRTDHQAAGLLALTNGPHVLSVDYLSESGFDDSAQVIFSVAAAAALIGIQVDPTTLSLTQGSTAALAVSGQFSDNTTQPITAQFSSSDTTIATVDSSGTVTAVAPGQALITVTYEAFTKTVSVSVTT